MPVAVQESKENRPGWRPPPAVYRQSRRPGSSGPVENAAKPKIDASTSPDATTNGWSAGRAATVACHGPNRSQPPAVRTQGIEAELPGESTDTPCHRQEIDPIPRISSKMPAIKRMGNGRGTEPVRAMRWGDATRWKSGGTGPRRTSDRYGFPPDLPGRKDCADQRRPAPVAAGALEKQGKSPARRRPPDRRPLKALPKRTTLLNAGFQMATLATSRRPR
jgi:hypothetical protein